MSCFAISSEVVSRIIINFLGFGNFSCESKKFANIKKGEGLYTMYKQSILKVN